MRENIVLEHPQLDHGPFDGGRKLRHFRRGGSDLATEETERVTEEGTPRHVELCLNQKSFQLGYHLFDGLHWKHCDSLHFGVSNLAI